MTKPTPSRETPTSIEPYRLDDDLREAIRERLFEQIQQAWALSDLAGMRLAGWTTHENRDLILHQRIEAMDDRQLIVLWDGTHPRSTQRAEASADIMAAVRARTFTCGRVQIQIPKYLIS